MSLIVRSMFWAACGAVMVLSLLPVEQLPPGVFDWWDKAQHALAFWVLGSLGLWAYAATSVRVAVGLVVFGALIELAQSATGWRFGDWQDWLADAVGVGVAYWVWGVSVKWQKTHGGQTRF